MKIKQLTSNLLIGAYVVLFGTMFFLVTCKNNERSKNFDAFKHEQLLKIKKQQKDYGITDEFKLRVLKKFINSEEEKENFLAYALKAKKEINKPYSDNAIDVYNDKSSLTTDEQIHILYLFMQKASKSSDFIKFTDRQSKAYEQFSKERDLIQQTSFIVSLELIYY